MEKLALEAKNLSKIFYPPLSFSDLIKLNFRGKKPIQAIDDLSFSLSSGKILGVLGPNGAGKTTLLKIISTLILPDKGQVKITGYDSRGNEEKIKSIIALCTSEERNLYWRLSGRQNLELFANLYGINKKDFTFKIERLLKEFNVTYADRRFDSYSSGMKRKISLIKSLLHEPQILLLDEPTKSLDYNSAFDLRDLIKRLADKQRTIILATHNMQEAQEICDIFMVLHKGKIFGLGTIEQLKKMANSSAADLAKIYLELTKNA